MIWYLVPGLCTVAYILFPVAFLSPRVGKEIVTTLTPLGLLVLGVLFGFVIDGLRMYRLRHDYDKCKSEFFRKLQSNIGTVLDPYYILSAINDMAIKEDNGSISLHHAIWIMHGNLAALSYAMSLVWIAISCYIGISYDNGETVEFFLVRSNYYVGFSTALLLAACFYFLGHRMMRISAEDQNTTNNMFLGFATTHRVKIREILSLL
jgi:uncharacterized membrane protein (DUF485 family)